MVLNAMVWTAGLDVPADGVKSNPVSEAELNQNLDKKPKMVHVSLPSDGDLTEPPAERIDYRWPGMAK